MKKILLLFGLFFMRTTSVLGANSYEKITCGDITIPSLVPEIVSTVILIIQIIVPIVLIIMGSIDITKAVAASKEDEIKKSQKLFLTRLITGVLVFLIFAIVKFAIGIVTPTGTNDSMWKCVNCVINNKC